MRYPRKAGTAALAALAALIGTTVAAEAQDGHPGRAPGGQPALSGDHGVVVDALLPGYDLDALELSRWQRDRIQRLTDTFHRRYGEDVHRLAREGRDARSLRHRPDHLRRAVEDYRRSVFGALTQGQRRHLAGHFHFPRFPGPFHGHGHGFLIVFLGLGPVHGHFGFPVHGHHLRVSHFHDHFHHHGFGHHHHHGFGHRFRRGGGHHLPRGVPFVNGFGHRFRTRAPDQGGRRSRPGFKFFFEGQD